MTTLPINDNKPLVLSGHSQIVWSVAFSLSNQLLASGSNDNTIRLWDAASGACIATLKGHTSTVWSVAFSPDITMLASGSSDTTVKLWDVESREEIARLEGHSSQVRCVAFSPDGTHLASGSEDGTIRLWETKSKISLSILNGHSKDVWSVTFSPDSKIIASGSGDSTIRLWNAESGTTVAIYTGHSFEVKSVVFSPSGEYLASGSADNTIRLWDVATGASIATLRGHSGTVRSVAFSPNGQYLASGSYDKTIRLWNVASRSHISTLEGHSRDVDCVVFSPDGTLLASGADDNTIRVWKVFAEEIVNQPVAILAPHPVELGETAIDNQQNTVTSSSTLSSLNDNFTRSLSLDGSTTYGQQDTVTSTSSSVTLNNDITGSVSLESTTLFSYGGFGELFLGTHVNHGKVALKKPRRLLDEALIRRFLREVDLWCSVSHQYILPCLGMCRVGPDVFVVSPFIENGDLLSCMTKGVNLNRSKLLFEVAEALTHLHHRGIVHGDVKAQNVLLANDGSALLCDFGLAKAFDTMATSTEVKGAGSVRWMAPELFLGKSRSMASDVYSLGITIAEVLSGRAPYEDLTEAFAVMFHVVNFDGRPAKEPMSSPEGKSYGILWETAEKCWVKDVKARPYMAQVLGMLFPLTREA